MEANGDKGGSTVTSSAAEIFVTERMHLGQLSAYHILVSQSGVYVHSPENIQGVLGDGKMSVQET